MPFSQGRSSLFFVEAAARSPNSPYLRCLDTGTWLTTTEGPKAFSIGSIYMQLTLVSWFPLLPGVKVDGVNRAVACVRPSICRTSVSNQGYVALRTQDTKCSVLYHRELTAFVASHTASYEDAQVLSLPQGIIHGSISIIATRRTHVPPRNEYH